MVAHPHHATAVQTQIVTLSDGGTASLSWWFAKAAVDCRSWHAGTAQRSPRTVVVFPGLNNSSHWPFVQQVANLLHRRGFTVAVFDYRGTAGMSLTSARCFGADSWRDVPEVISAVRARTPRDAELYAIGHSMGGAVLCKYLEQCGAACPIRAAATISAPLSLSKHMRRLEASLTWRLANFGTMAFARMQLYKLWLTDPASRPHLTAVRWWDLLHATTLREFEHATLCAINGFETAEHYYAFAQSDISRVQTPMLVVHARDDPVIGVCGLPIDALQSNPHVTLVLTDSGGHLGYFGRAEGCSELDEMVAGFFDGQRGGGQVPTRARL